MRSFILAFTCVIIVGTCALLSHSAEETINVQIQLVDADTNQPIAGIIRIFPADGKKALTLPGLVDRLQGIKRSDKVQGWFVLPSEGASLMLLRQELRVEALSGLETELAQQSIDPKTTKKIQIKVKAIFRPEKHSLVAGNTHLHLRNMTLSKADQYLKTIPTADRLKVLFISYLERNKDDKHYITNRYPVGDLKKLQVAGVLINNGEEHRHNFEAYKQGYGHVMFLNIQKLVQPVSLGQGITCRGNDDLMLAPGIANAREKGGSVIWCHNTFGHEDIIHALAGRLDAVNVFDGSRRDSYDDTWYHYLNIGLRLPISTGTDWFMYDFSRVYALVSQKKVTIPSWLQALKAGRNHVTNGPLLSIEVNGSSPGEVVALKKTNKVSVKVRALGRSNFGKLQLVHNGKVIHSASAKKKANHFQSEINIQMPLGEACWLAARIETTNRNEFGQPLFAHTSPVYVDLNGKSVFKLSSAQELLKQLGEGRAAIRAQGMFTSDRARDRVLKSYDEAVADLKKRINNRGK